MVQYELERGWNIRSISLLTREEVVRRHLLGIGVSVTCGVLMVASLAGADTIAKQVEIARPLVATQGDVCVVSVPGLPMVGSAGEPLLPAYGMRILLPQGEKVTGVTIDALVQQELRLDLPIQWAQPQVPLSQTGPHRRIPADRKIYFSEAPFPSQRAIHVTTETYRGYNIAFLRIYPVTYIGASQTIVYTTRFDVHIETAPTAASARRGRTTLRTGLQKDIQELKRLVDDSSAASSYVAEERFPTLGAAMTNPEETYPYVIITDSDLVTTFEPLRDHRTAMGLRGKIVEVDSINSNYTGDDLPEKIRNFIKDAYLDWETEYVLLGGDDDIIPHRGLYADAGGGYTDDDIASDLYYGALDGTWNDDGDSYWGEPDEADLIPEVVVGRASVETETEANNFLSKLFKYEDSPVLGQIKVGQMVGELLWSDPTWGGDSKDEIKYGASTHGYTTVGFPPSFTVHTLYDRDLDPDEWDMDDLIPLLNSGRHLVNHLGHSDVTYGLRMYNSDVETRFTNDGVSNQYFILYTQGCYSGSFDNRSPGGSYGDDCLGEHFHFIENGAVAFIGNTRYGWGQHGSTNGANQYYDRQFFDAIFGEDVTVIGKANDDSKVDNIPYVDVGPNRWVYYQLVLLGDPAMDIWTDTPGYLTVDAPDIIYVGDNEIAIGVTDGSNPLEGARVSIFDTGSYNYAFTEPGGVVYIDPLADQPGSLMVSVRAHNFYTYLDTLPVVNPNHAVVVIDDYTVDDDEVGGSLGNSNGVADDGETVETVVTLINVGQDSAFSVWALLETADPYVTVLDSVGSYGDLAPDSSVTPGWDFLYEISPETPDSHLVTFALNISHSDTAYAKHFGVMVSAPVLRIAEAAVSDTLYGNGDYCLEPGETVELAITFDNRGSGEGEGVSVLLAESDPYVTLESDSAYASTIVAGGQATPQPSFVLGFLPDCPEFHQVELEIQMFFASGREDLDTLTVTVGGSLEDDMESGSPNMVHMDFVDGFVDEWHLETNRNHTDGGAYSWKFGGSGGTRYSDTAHGALVTPEMCLGPNATFTFWHFCKAETADATYAWDGGIVEISTDGGDSWSQITPVGGYQKKIYPNADSPFEGDTPCFAWYTEWTQVEFDLSAYQGAAMVRFRFGSDGYIGYEGWYIDDINVTDDLASVDIDDRDLKVVPAEFALHSVSPNPFSSSAVLSFDVPRTSRVAVSLYDVRGRVVKELADLVAEPGRYSLTLGEENDLPSGVYFLKMRAEDFSKTRKVVIVK
jgi:hypothetical protein